MTLGYRTATVDGLKVFYRSAGDPKYPAVLLLHGFPTSSHMFRNLIPALADRYYVVAPDLPGFGFSDAPDRASFKYSFDHLAEVIDRFTEVLKLKRYAIYVFDYGAPVGFRLALRHPERITAIISQNGNAYLEGLSEGWNPIQAYWKDPSSENRAALRAFLKPEATQWQYTHGVTDPERLSPDAWTLDSALLARPGNDEIQLDLFGDYQSNLALYPKFQDYIRTRRPPLLAVWGKNDPFFLPPGAQAFQRDNPDAEIHLLDAGHFALESHAPEIAAIIRDFLARKLTQRAQVASAQISHQSRNTIMSKTSKTILITGASSGFGRDTAETLARAGHNVFASMREVNGKHRDQANELRKQGIVVVELDVSNDASVDAAVNEVLTRAGHIDVLVNNAGIASAGVTEAFTAEQAKVIFNTNVVGLLRTSRAVLPAMRAQGDGLIINIGSILGRVTFPFFGIYGASKFAVEALTESLRYEVSQLGIEVVLVQPSAYPTNMYAAIQQPADAARAAGYGAVGEIPGKIFETFKVMFASANAPNPHDVAGAIADLIATPRGARAARLVVGQAFGADAVNDAVAPVQHRVLEGLGLGALTILAKRAA